jgi:hypothetical protein
MLMKMHTYQRHTEVLKFRISGAAVAPLSQLKAPHVDSVGKKLKRTETGLQWHDVHHRFN